MTYIFDEPSNLDLHKEQARQGALMERMSDDVKEIKHCLLGHDDHPGLVLEVDRLKRGQKRAKAVHCVVFTTVLGTAATVLAKFFGS